MNWIELVREYFPNCTDIEADFILWEKTCFPFGPVEMVKNQLLELKDNGNK